MTHKCSTTKKLLKCQRPPCLLCGRRVFLCVCASFNTWRHFRHTTHTVCLFLRMISHHKVQNSGESSIPCDTAQTRHTALSAWVGAKWKNTPETAITPEQSINNYYKDEWGWTHWSCGWDATMMICAMATSWSCERSGQRWSEADGDTALIYPEHDPDPNTDTDTEDFSNDFPVVTPMDIPAAWKTPAMESERRIKARDETPKNKRNDSVWRSD